ncbi:hypothetical protein DFQ28_002429 [Apophysomyces sp. BC1034]|nr:hypothetical protein DFQ30_000478 [Apophysomyces sp. BC1015]KAG0177849.1 hypothetical protein DFQ29_004274 [Apophysomyces sp. BC1021]KAG0190149.1 hypothetical protein DFQ28_002429 [Apophysomyces sp. BC1034]
MGELKNPYGPDKPKDATGGIGPFKIGDYDDPGQGQSENTPEEVVKKIKEHASKIANKVVEEESSTKKQ